MDLQTYIQQSSGWLVDTTIIYDLAEAAQKACNVDWKPSAADDADGPHLISRTSRAHFAAALPLGTKTSKEAQRAAFVAMGEFPPSSSDVGVKVPVLNGKDPRIGAILARAGIIAQFELWKAFVRQYPDYPFNLKDARKYTFAHAQEREIVFGLIEDRNALTHEIRTSIDPTMRRLVDYTWESQHVAQWVAKLYQTEDPINGKAPERARRV